MSYSEAERLLRETDLHRREISNLTGVSISALRRIEIRSQLRCYSPDSQAAAEMAGSEYDAETRAACALLKTGMRARHVAKQLDISESRVRRLSRLQEVRSHTGQRTEYIYGLQCPDSRQFYYIGRSANPWVRYRAHMRTPTSDVAAEWIRELQSDGLSPLLVIIQTVQDNEAAETENALIYEYRKAGHPLLNREVRPWQ